MSDTSAAPVPDEIKLVYQQHPGACGVATTAMIAGVSYVEAWGRLAPPPSNAEPIAAYHQREMRFLNEKGWWASAQLLLKTVISLDEMDSIIDSEEIFKTVVENSQRVRILLAFADGTEPDHAVVWDKDHSDVVFDPARGVVPVSKLFNHAGLQSYSGTRGFIAFRYQPGKPIQTLVKSEEGFVPPIPPPAGEVRFTICPARIFCYGISY